MEKTDEKRPADIRVLKGQIFDLLKRHPARVEDVAETFGMTQGQTLALLRKLEGEGRAQHANGHWSAL